MTDTRTELQKMLAGDLYHAGDPALAAARAAAAAWMQRYNAASAATSAERHALLQAMLGEAGPAAAIRPPFHCDYGFNIRLGAEAFLNFSCVILDVTAVTIGDRTQIGPAVQIYTADHPRDPAVRRSGAEFGRPVHIGADVWIGGGAIILPGVSIGDGAVIGGGSVVTRDVPPGAMARGNPARLALPNHARAARGDVDRGSA